MRLDDVDGIFPKGSRDKFWECDDCNASAIEHIRNNESVKTTWSKEQ